MLQTDLLFWISQVMSWKHLDQPCVAGNVEYFFLSCLGFSMVSLLSTFSNYVRSCRPGKSENCRCMDMLYARVSVAVPQTQDILVLGSMTGALCM